MSGEDIFGLIIMLMVSLGMGALCYGLGVSAARSKKPFGFWTGTEVKSESISDISAYNRENAKMWKLYSIPYFLSGLCTLSGIWVPMIQMFSVILLGAVSMIGIGWLIWKYKRIIRKYSR